MSDASAAQSPRTFTLTDVDDVVRVVVEFVEVYAVCRTGARV